MPIGKRWRTERRTSLQSRAGVQSRYLCGDLLRPGIQPVLKDSYWADYPHVMKHCVDLTKCPWLWTLDIKYEMLLVTNSMWATWHQGSPEIMIEFFTVKDTCSFNSLKSHNNQCNTQVRSTLLVREARRKLVVILQPSRGHKGSNGDALHPSKCFSKHTFTDIWGIDQENPFKCYVPG